MRNFSFQSTFLKKNVKSKMNCLQTHSEKNGGETILIWYKIHKKSNCSDKKNLWMFELSVE